MEQGNKLLHEKLASFWLPVGTSSLKHWP